MKVVSLLIGIIIFVLNTMLFAFCEEKDITSGYILNIQPTQNYQYLLILSNGEKILLSSRKDMSSQIDSIHTESIKFNATIDNGCGKGYFLFNDDDNYKFFNSSEKYLLYTQYIENDVEPTALNLTQNENHFYFNLSNEKLINEYCQFNGRRVLIDALLIKVYSGKEQFNYVTITDIKFQ